MQTNFSDRAGVWNYLSTDQRQPDLSYSHFRQSLKTFLFRQLDQNAVQNNIKMTFPINYKGH